MSIRINKIQIQNTINFSLKTSLLWLLVPIFLMINNGVSAKNVSDEKTQHFNLSMLDYPGAVERYGPALSKAYQKLGISIEFTKLTAGLSIKDTNNGHFDGDLMRGRGIEKKYTNLIAVGKPLASANIVVLCQKSLPCDNNIINIANTVVHSVITTKTWNQALLTTAVSIEYHTSLTELKTLFLAKKIDYMVFTLDSAGFFNADSLDANVMKKPLMVVKTHHYIHKKHSAIAKPLARAINEAFSL